ncbi:hypothetical protein JK358_38370 [Nocardia sp. 2]|uniref:Uncharacterized protein n=1 Tax=Nocardia acididurans TaxID=2802282 RepID=A0ABS1MHZ6_9NOCA|nr:2-hydroxyacid dehydrogenase [Nocardia acididurans]MBL1080278.1 hypothetical protein [Nocardia acididurans]
MSRHRALVTGSMLSSAELASIEHDGLDVEVIEQTLGEAELSRALADKDAFILGGNEYVSATVLSATARTRVIAFLGVGYHSFIDVGAASAAGIAVTNAPGANRRAVAEFSIGLILDSVRSISHQALRTKVGRWEEVRGFELAGKTLGVFGMGSIGSTVARIATNGFGMRVVYANRSPKPEIEAELSARRVGLDDLFALSQIISLHVAYSDGLKGVVDSALLRTVRPGAVLVNAADPRLVDPEALHNALIENRLRAAAMDGYYIQPPPAVDDDPHRLLALGEDRFLLTPHAASATADSCRAMLAANLSSIRNVLSTGTDPNIVNPEFRRHPRWRSRLT